MEKSYVTLASVRRLAAPSSPLKVALVAVHITSSTANNDGVRREVRGELEKLYPSASAEEEHTWSDIVSSSTSAVVSSTATICAGATCHAIARRSWWSVAAEKKDNGGGGIQDAHIEVHVVYRTFVNNLWPADDDIAIILWTKITPIPIKLVYIQNDNGMTVLLELPLLLSTGRPPIRCIWHNLY